MCFRRMFIAFSTLAVFACSQPPKESEALIEPKVVIITMFERGADSGDAAGEFQLWNERQALTEVLESGAHHHYHYTADTGVLGIVTGIGTAKAAASVMALGMDPRFDLSKSYWMVAGIAGFDPEDASLGSVAWAEFLVDGDIAHHIDAREKPENPMVRRIASMATLRSGPISSPRIRIYSTRIR